MEKNSYLKYDELPLQEELPNPFIDKDNKEIKTKTQWREHQKELKEMLTHYMFGKTPEPPKIVSGIRTAREECLKGVGIYEEYELTDERNLSIRVKITRPRNDKKCPVIIWNQFKEMERCPIEKKMIKKGYAILSFNRNQFVPDIEGVKEFGKGAFQKAYPEYKEARAIAIWAWGCSYCATWLLSQDFAGELIVTGFSRGGKVALCAAAYDERFKICAPVSSGMGGGGCFRFMGGRLGEGIEETESLGWMLRKDRFWYWYQDELAEFGNTESFASLGEEKRLPFDLHTLRALIAPRAIIGIEGLSDHLSDGYGTQVTWRAAQEVYDFLNAKGKNALAFLEGGHEFGKERWNLILDFCEVIIKGKKQKLNYRRFDENTILPLSEKPLKIPALHFSWRNPKKEDKE